MSYTKRGINSFNLLKKNLVLFVPDLIYIIIFIITALIFLQLTGLLSSIINNFYDLEALKTQFKSLISNSPILIKFLIALAVFIIVNFIIGVSLQAVKLDMVKSLIKNKKAGFKESFKNSKEYVLTLILVKILIYLMFLIPISIVIILQVLFKQTPLFILLLIATILFYIYLLFSLFFINPTIFLKTNKTIASLKESFSYFKKNKKHTIYTLLFVIVISIVFSYLISLFQFGFSFLPATMVLMLTITFNIISFIINKIISIWKEIFIFLNYLRKD